MLGPFGLLELCIYIYLFILFITDVLRLNLNWVQGK